jgi:hypothetical protein
MSRRHRRDRRRPESHGWDTVKTPFGFRTVAKGQGWSEAAKWGMLRLLGQIVLFGALALLGWFVLVNVFHH